MENFNDLMQEAVKLKGAQMSKERKLWESYPKFFQHTVFHKSPLTDLRLEDFRKRMDAALELKKIGNHCMKVSKGETHVIVLA